MTKRIEWIDIWKGIGIVTVVVGHIVQVPLKNYIYWFHMPLFFFISGYLFRPNNDYYNFFRNKSKSFLVPYLTFLILLTIPEYLLYYFQATDSSIFSKLAKMTVYKIAGGAYIYGWFDVFWFITCLFFTQQLYNFIYCQFQGDKKHRLIFFSIIIATYFLAMIDSYLFPQKNLPWGLNIMLFALPFYFLGHFVAQSSFFNKINFQVLILVLIVFTLGIIFNDKLGININMDLKKKQYGFILLNIILPLSGIFITQYLAILINKITHLNQALISLGKSSLIIMYLHQFFRSFLLNNSIYTQIFICLLIPYLVYQIFKQFSLTRKFFLGDFRVKKINY